MRASTAFAILSLAAGFPAAAHGASLEQCAAALTAEGIHFEEVSAGGQTYLRVWAGTGDGMHPMNERAHQLEQDPRLQAAQWQSGGSSIYIDPLRENGQAEFIIGSGDVLLPNPESLGGDWNRMHMELEHEVTHGFLMADFLGTRGIPHFINTIVGGDVFSMFTPTIPGAVSVSQIYGEEYFAQEIPAYETSHATELAQGAVDRAQSTERMLTILRGATEGAANEVLGYLQQIDPAALAAGLGAPGVHSYTIDLPNPHSPGQTARVTFNYSRYGRFKNQHYFLNVRVERAHAPQTLGGRPGAYEVMIPMAAGNVQVPHAQARQVAMHQLSELALYARGGEGAPALPVDVTTRCLLNPSGSGCGPLQPPRP